MVTPDPLNAILESDRCAANLERPEFVTHMEPRDFIKDFPVTYAEMARICCCSEDTVKQWFSKGTAHREPREHHKVILAYTYHAWKTRDSEPIYSQEIYERVKERKQKN